MQLIGFRLLKVQPTFIPHEFKTSATYSCANTIGMGVGCISPGSGGVCSGVNGSGGGTLGLVAMLGFLSNI